MGARWSALALAGVAALAVASSASAATVRTPGHINPMVPVSSVGNDTVTSTNWSGYAVQSSPGPFTYVVGTWTEPQVTCPSTSAQYASFWVGIDGYTSNSVEQLGTDSDCKGLNRPSYYAWYEMYPAYSVNIPNPVNAGDSMTAYVSVTGTAFTLNIHDTTAGWTFSKTISQTGLAQSSAEWIAESPEICSRRCSLAQLSDFGTMSFTGSGAAVGGSTTAQPISFSSFTNHEIVGVTKSGTVRAQPSGLTSGGTAFSITWKHN
jgi:hypothetical protein